MKNNNISNNLNSNVAINGNQTINNYAMLIDIDIGRLQNICDTNAIQIIELLHGLDNNQQNIEYDDAFIKMEIKNKNNELEKFYEEFIKKEESKLAILDDFFKANNQTKQIEEAAKSIRMAIFSFNDRNLSKLTPSIFNKVLCEHTKNIVDIESKNIMELIIFYLYRYCYIGDKNGN